MPKESKQFGAKATNSFNKKFSQSIFNLTCLYAVIIFIILLISSSITYSFFHHRLNRRFANFPPVVAQQQIFIVQSPMPLPTASTVSEDLIESLLLVNGLLFILSVTLSYLLARLTLKPIQDAYDNQRRFLSDASHELRTPLSILYTNLENELAEKNLKPDEREFALSNLEEAKRMNKIINDLLTLSRLDESAASIELSDFDLNALINDIVKRLDTLAKSHETALDFAQAASSPLTIYSDKNLLEQALANIIKNAINYNKVGGKVDLAVEKRGKETSIIIKDTGIGMNEADLSKVFNRFYRSDKSRSRLTGGSGLGLAIAKESIEKIGGAIKIDSQPEIGTTIEILLPNRS